MWFGRILAVLIVFFGKFIYSQDLENSNVSEEITSTPRSTYIDETTFETTSKIEHDSDKTGDSSSEESATEALLAKGEKKISETILKMLEHFKKPNPEGIPGVDIPDPYEDVPDMKKAVTYFDYLYLENIKLYGLSKMKLLYVSADFEDMEVNAEMSIDELQTKGTYRYSSLLMPRRGPFTVNVTGLKITPRGTLGVGLDGKLRTQDINIEIAFDTITVNFENLGSLGNILQNFINSAGHYIFDNMKPQLLKDAYTKARLEMDKKIGELAGDIEFPNSIAPLDMILVDARRKAKELGYDPYRLQDCNDTAMSLVTVSLTNIWITGLSSFHRIGDMILSLENNTVTATFQIGSQQLVGSSWWEVSTGLMGVTGTASFSVQYVSARIVVAQSLDTRQRPQLREFHLDVGNIQARCDGAGTIDYVIELVVNIIPNMLRHQVVSALEEPLKAKLQEELDSVDMEEEIKMALPRIDELAETGFKLSFLREGKETVYDDDEFFNF